MDTMNSQYESDNNSEQKLDTEFRQILYAIKPRITEINSMHYLAQYRIWLEKLNDADQSEKAERNKLLFELAKQIVNRTLEHPFNEPPPDGPIKDMNLCFPGSNVESNMSVLSCTSNKWYDSETVEKSNITGNQDLYFTPEMLGTANLSYSSTIPQHNIGSYSNFTDSTFENFYGQTYPETSTDGIDNSKTKRNPKYRRRKSKSVGRNLVNDDTPDIQRLQQFVHPLNVPNTSNKLLCSQMNAYPPVEIKKADFRALAKEISRDFKKPPESIPEESSWCDLTDDSVIQFGSGDAEKLTVVKPLDKDKIHSSGNDVTSTKNSRSEEVRAEKHAVYTSLSGEVEALKSRLRDLNEVKYALKDTNYITADWKKTIEGLQIRLTETTNQNNELKSVMTNLKIKIQEIEAAKNKENSELKNKLTEAHSKELDALKRKQEDNIRGLEKSFHAKLNEVEQSFQKRLIDVKSSYDLKVREMNLEYEKAVKDRDEEILRLNSIIQEQCLRMSDEVSALRRHIEHCMSHSSDEKIIFLQKCVSKMDKLFQKSEREYLRQIEKLKHEMDLREKAAQIQLRTQRTEMIARNSAQKQSELDAIINKLEVRYIRMLEAQEAQSLEARKQDEQTIEELKSVLDMHNIPYDITS